MTWAAADRRRFKENIMKRVAKALENSKQIQEIPYSVNYREGSKFIHLRVLHEHSTGPHLFLLEIKEVYV